MIDIYADESCKENHRHLILGGVAIQTENVPNVLTSLKEVRDKFNTHGEVKWTKASKSKLDFYKAFINVFFDLNRKNEASFHCLTVDTGTFNHHAFNQGNAEIGFNKLIYQLLLHRFGVRYGEKFRIYVYLDKRNTSQQPDMLRPMLNSALKRKSIGTYPFKRLTFQDSKSSDIIQLNDLLIGAIGFRKNGHHLAENCSAHKLQLAQHILKQAVEIQHPIRINSRDADKFSVWNFEFKKRVLGA
ncbi:MAG TPA: DUF3800 domain-containing protein [Burkholderiaceae bacterium]|nr:DUF3800 domain-containing protein [Burkholderiaceae bacterium]